MKSKVNHKMPTQYEIIIKTKLSEHLGIDVGDIDISDSLTQDLHMNPSSLTDFVHLLQKSGFSLDLTDISNIRTVSDLVDIVTEKEEF